MVAYRTFTISNISTEEFSEGYSNIKDDSLVKAFLKQTESESDRSVVLIAAAFLDSLLEDKLKLVFGKGNNASREKLFGVMGPFGSMGSKTEALFCAGKIAKDIYQDLNIVRRLRNTCAHEWQEFRFVGKVDDNFVSKLESRILLDSLVGEASSLPIHPRSKFMIIVGSLIFVLNIDKVNTQQRE